MRTSVRAGRHSRWIVFTSGFSTSFPSPSNTDTSGASVGPTVPARPIRDDPFLAENHTRASARFNLKQLTTSPARNVAKTRLERRHPEHLTQSLRFAPECELLSA